MIHQRAVALPGLQRAVLLRQFGVLLPASLGLGIFDQPQEILGRVVCEHRYSPYDRDGALMQQLDLRIDWRLTG